MNATSTIATLNIQTGASLTGAAGQGLTVTGAATVTGTLNVNASHGVSGVAPRWSLAIGLGTAFPYLTHVGAGTPIDALRNTFGGGTHGLGNGTGGTTPGNSGNAGGGGNGRGRKTL